ncbi:MAG: hypothetical protein ACOYYS_26450 [Chloroflexota bacterium]
MRKTFVIVLLVVLSMSLLIVLPAVAFEADNNGVIAADRVIDDDLFIEAQEVIIDGTVNGDLFVNGSEVVINGPVNGNLLIFSAIAEVNGPVSGSIVFAGQSLALYGHVNGSLYGTGGSAVLMPGARLERNVYFAGYSFQSMPGSAVEVDVSLVGYQAILQGDIERNVYAAVSALEIDGSVGGNLDVTVDPPEEGSLTLTFGDGLMPDAIPSGIRVSEEADIAGILNYVSTVEQGSEIALPAGQVTYRTLEVKEKLSPAEAFRKRSLSAVEAFVTLLIMGAVALWLLPRPVQKSTQAARRLLPALGSGLVIFFLSVPVAFLLGGAIAIAGVLFGVVTLSTLTFLVYVIGYLALALAVLLFFVLAVYGSKLIVANAVGNWLLQRFWPGGYAGRPFWPLLVGLVIYLPISLLPLPIEIFITLMVSFIGLGAMWLAFRQRNGLPELPTTPAPAALAELDEAVR